MIEEFVIGTVVPFAAQAAILPRLDAIFIMLIDKLTRKVYVMNVVKKTNTPIQKRIGGFTENAHKNQKFQNVHIRSLTEFHFVGNFLTIFTAYQKNKNDYVTGDFLNYNLINIYSSNTLLLIPKSE